MGKIAFLFAGQGAQKPGMGSDLYEQVDVAKEVFDMGEALRPGTLKQCFQSTQEILTKTENTQPCLFLMDLACARVLESYGVKADMAAGFSLGEIAAISFTGILSDEEAFRLVVCRGNKMAQCSASQPGSMMAVLRMTGEQVEELCKDYQDVYAVNFNCPGQTVVAGAKEIMPSFADAIKAAGGRTIPLAVSGAFHTPYMLEATKALEECLKNLTVKESNIPLISNMTAMSYPNNKEEICSLISRQASNSVRWEESLRYIYESGVDTFIEVGAGTALTGLVKKTLEDKVKIFNVSDIESLKNVVKELTGKAVRNA